ncbi:MAG: DNA-3-methyladenine glycosylase I [Gemmatimonadaceae bacterium]
MKSLAAGLLRHDDGLVRCWWCGTDPLYVQYHDSEWGTPVTDEHRLFEKLSLEGFQAGLSWITILRKREAFREAFAGFDPAKVAAFGSRDVTRLLGNAQIVRHRGKIEAVVSNARCYAELRAEGRSLADFLWSFAPAAPTPRAASARRTTRAEVPNITAESTALSRALKQRGWKFVGPTTMYAMFQAMGLVNDHLTGCFRHSQVEALLRPARRSR